MLGKVFALCTDEEQAQFLNEAGRALKRTCEANCYAEMQLMRVTDRLDERGRWLVLQLAKMLDADGAR